jgi:hypothetical protein
MIDKHQVARELFAVAREAAGMVVHVEGEKAVVQDVLDKATTVLEDARQLLRDINYLSTSVDPMDRETPKVVYALMGQAETAMNTANLFCQAVRNQVRRM